MIAVPTQSLADGVTVIVATTGVVPTLVAVNDGRLPVPEASNPIVRSLVVQEYVVPKTGLVKVMTLETEPLQYDTFETGTTVGVGLTVIVNVSGVPTQLLTVGVTVIVATTGVVPVFVAVKDGKFPIPEAANPIVRSLVVQVNVVPVTGLVNVISLEGELLQYSRFETDATVDVGFTVIVND